MKPVLFAAAVAILAGCGPLVTRVDAQDEYLGAPETGRLKDRQARDVGGVPMPSGITCDRNAAGYAEGCTAP
jgi:hypothetical protein